ncbi:hypothetical protein Tco_0842478 [Tanacetum coccineum]|uniref:Uncharacterized protein n=1 Tax=Tanacetum coccineum TaxID=301880 RepID=A0ABQ5AZE0_9ASTR
MDKSSSHLLPLSWRSKHLEIFTRTETFCFDLEENSSGSTTTHSDYSLPDYEAFYSDDDHIKEKSSGSRYHLLCLIFSKYDSFIFDLSINPFPPTDRNDFYHEEFAGSGYHQKDRKPSQNDKTEHGMEKTVQNQGQSPKMPKSESILKNQQSNRSRN